MRGVLQGMTEKTKRLVDGIFKDRACLARAITLIENKRPDVQHQGQLLLKSVLQQRQIQKQKQNNESASLSSSSLPHHKLLKDSFRIGISGPPGAGKSSFIEVFGRMLTQQLELHVAVLAVDPSSTRTKGSILGDKTRMVELGRDPRAYVRPSPTGGTLGGVARNTSDAVVLCEAAGYDVVLVETVGVGQSETTVADMVDMFVLIVPPAAGDELQGIKKGVVELADLVIVNKADGELKTAAIKTQTELVSALKILQPKDSNWAPRVLPVSTVLSTGIDKVWDTMLEYHHTQLERGLLHERRRQQLKIWMWSHIQDTLLHLFKRDPSVKAAVERIEQDVLKEAITPGYAADKLIEEFIANKGKQEQD
eukprot:Nk52_evm20s217 gene=Nk52_evmTU20s217